MLALGPLPDLILLEDAEDIALFLEATGRTVSRSKWCEQLVYSRTVAMAESFF